MSAFDPLRTVAEAAYRRRMTDESKFDEEVLGAVRQVLALVPPEVASVSESTDDYGHMIHVEPASDVWCELWLDFSTYGTYGLWFGHGLGFEDLPIAQFSPVDVANAVLSGHVSETVWRRRGKVIKSVGEIRLEDGTVLHDTGYLAFLPFERLGQRQEIEYLAYPTRR